MNFQSKTIFIIANKKSLLRLINNTGRDVKYFLKADIFLSFNIKDMTLIHIKVKSLLSIFYSCIWIYLRDIIFSIYRVIDLVHPEGPINTMNSPSLMWRSIPWTALNTHMRIIKKTIDKFNYLRPQVFFKYYYLL